MYQVFSKAGNTKEISFSEIFSVNMAWYGGALGLKGLRCVVWITVFNIIDLLSAIWSVTVKPQTVFF